VAAAVRRARINIARSTTPPLRANTLAAHAETAAKERPATPRCARGKVPRAGVDITSRRQPADVASANSNVASCVPCAKHVLTSVNRAILRSPAPLTATPPVDEAASTRANNLGIQTFNQSKCRRKRQRCGRATQERQKVQPHPNERPTGRNCGKNFEKIPDETRQTSPSENCWAFNWNVSFVELNA
jgi:hypothetical protein